MVKWLLHPRGKCECILTRSLEVTECRNEVSSPTKLIMRNSKIWNMNSWSPQSTGIESLSQKWLFLMLWSSTAYQTFCEYSNQSNARKFQTNSEAAKLGKWNLPVNQPCNLHQCRKVERGVDVFLQSCAQRESKLHWKFQISSAWNLRSMKFHSKVQSGNETKICA